MNLKEINNQIKSYYKHSDFLIPMCEKNLENNLVGRYRLELMGNVLAIYMDDYCFGKWNTETLLKSNGFCLDSNENHEINEAEILWIKKYIIQNQKN